MIVREAYQDLTLEEAQLACSEAKAAQPDAVTQIIEQDDGMWTVVIAYDDGKAAPLAEADAAAPAPPC
ncbi:hypothetical protein AAKU55_001144 [Oxalobacteraceae bacterium GrIS 1.11]